MKTGAYSSTVQPGSASFNGLGDLAMLTNEYVAGKLTRNNYKKVLVQFTV